MRIALFAASFVALACVPFSASASQASSASANPFRPGAVLVGFRSGVAGPELHAIEQAVGAYDARRLGPPIKSVGHGRVRSQEFLAPFELQVADGRVLSVVRRLRHSRAVAYAEPDYLMHGTATPNDPSFGLEWWANNTSQAIPTQESEEVLGEPLAGTPGADDGALKAWRVTTGSRSIVIGETDTGVEYTHPDLAANIWSNPGGIGGCTAGTHGYDVLSKTCNPMDEDTNFGGHGTHVAGIMGAVGNNGEGVAGMNWQTSILPVKWMQNASSGETSALIEAMQWLVAAKQEGVNVRVVNDSDSFFGTAKSEALENEIEVLGANNMLFVASAGNTGHDNDEVAVQRYPCSYDRPNEICATSSNNKDELPSWANYGPHTVDLAAPGVSILSTLREAKYGYLTGGSMAAAQVSGAAALILSAEPSLSASALKADILENVDKLPSLAGKVISGGRLDVCKALPGCETLPPPPAVPTPASGLSAAHEQSIQSAAISGLMISPGAFVAAGHGPTISRRMVSGGATVSYSDSEPALVRFTVLALRSGVENAEHRCGAPAHGKRKVGGRRCNRYVEVGRFVNQDRTGRNSFHFSGRIAGRKLVPGRYRLQAIPTFGGRAGVGRAAMFRIVREPRVGSGRNLGGLAAPS
jgi:thermitase